MRAGRRASLEHETNGYCLFLTDDGGGGDAAAAAAATGDGDGGGVIGIAHVGSKQYGVPMK